MLEEVKDSGKEEGKSITTGIDALYDIVKVRGRMKVSLLALRLHVKPALVLHWAGILEQQGLVKIHYPLFGGVEVVKA